MVSMQTPGAIASAKDIREALAHVAESVIAQLQRLGATAYGGRQAGAWLGGNDSLRRRFKHTAHGGVAPVIDLLDVVLQFPEEKLHVRRSAPNRLAGDQFLE